MKLARVIRFDRSDLNIFPLAAEEGEWAITGSFAFSRLAEEEIKGKTRQAFSNGFMGIPSFGYSTLVTVATAGAGDAEAMADHLARHFVSDYGAPSEELARKAAEEEIGFIEDVCREHGTGTLLSVSREMCDDGIRESFRAIPKAESCSNQQLWTVVEDGEDGEDGGGDSGQTETKRSSP